jgi:hypothetical protein
MKSKTKATRLRILKHHPNHSQFAIGEIVIVKEVRDNSIVVCSLNNQQEYWSLSKGAGNVDWEIVS